MFILNYKFYNHQPYKNMFQKQKIHGKKNLPINRQAIGAQLLLGSTAALQQLKAKDVQSHEMPMEEEVHVVSLSLFHFFGWEVAIGVDILVGFARTDSGCKVKFGKRGIHEQNDVVFSFRWMLEVKKIYLWNTCRGCLKGGTLHKKERF